MIKINGSKILKYISSLPIKDEQIKFLASQLANFTDAIALLQKENTALKTDNSNLSTIIETLKAQLPPNGFIEADGFFIKKNPAGGVFKTPYCPHCFKPMVKAGGGMYICSAHKTYKLIRREVEIIIHQFLEMNR